jgi:hypothetical protein
MADLLQEWLASAGYRRILAGGGAFRELICA